MERMKLIEAEKVTEEMEELGDLECILRIPEEKEQMDQTQNKSVQNGG